ncbi:cytochrome c3 family protein [Desulfovermiculus halophilus]|uniref:cytochrome c3 family protein n=1 Tax=Desulfovermiculus halophilus TaxID=339722 RepID=UPI0004850EC5|nr:NapC/NirT family cytochrome c [Desulfovermiculus halophilus]
MRRGYKALILILLGIIIGFPVFSMAYYTMVRTSTPQFCASCHEIEYAYNTWKTSTHANNPKGFVADCMDCHLPAPENTFEFFYSKTYHGIKDVVKHFTMDTSEYDHEKNRQRAYEDIDNSQCQKCHRNLLDMAHKRGAMLAHKTVLYPREGYEKKCVDCHDRLVHFPRDDYAYDQAVLDAESTGL